MFSNRLIIGEIGFEKWQLETPFTFNSITGLTVTVDDGFICDLASVPGIAQSLVSKMGYWTQPAVLHDWLYHRHRNGLDKVVTRLQADNMFIEGCRIKAAEYDVPLLERREWLLYGGVRAGGWGSWATPEETKEMQEKDLLPDYFN